MLLPVHHPTLRGSVDQNTESWKASSNIQLQRLVGLGTGFHPGNHEPLLAVLG